MLYWWLSAVTSATVILIEPLVERGVVELVRKDWNFVHFV